MSLKQQCKDAIYNYVDQETQNNAAMFGEHKAYVELVITVLRAEYNRQLADGATSFTVSDEIDTLLTQECPW